MLRFGMVAYLVIASTAAATANCVHNNKSEGEGSIVEMPGKNLRVCKNGAWQVVQPNILIHAVSWNSPEDLARVKHICQNKPICQPPAAHWFFKSSGAPRVLSITWSCSDKSEQYVTNTQFDNVAVLSCG